VLQKGAKGEGRKKTVFITQKKGKRGTIRIVSGGGGDLHPSLLNSGEKIARNAGFHWVRHKGKGGRGEFPFYMRVSQACSGKKGNRYGNILNVVVALKRGRETLLKEEREGFLTVPVGKRKKGMPQGHCIFLGKGFLAKGFRGRREASSTRRPEGTLPQKGEKKTVSVGRKEKEVMTCVWREEREIGGGNAAFKGDLQKVIRDWMPVS